MKRAKIWLKKALEVEHLPWWASLPPLGVRRHVWPLAWHKTDIKDPDLEGAVVWNPILRCYDLSVRVGSVSFAERAAHLHEVMAAVERFRGRVYPIPSTQTL